MKQAIADKTSVAVNRSNTPKKATGKMLMTEHITVEPPLALMAQGYLTNTQNGQRFPIAQESMQLKEIKKLLMQRVKQGSDQLVPDNYTRRR
jgi:hypothetical protein